MKYTAFALALLLAGCASGDYAGPERGFQGSVDTFWADFAGVSTTYKNDESPMQATITPDGQADMVSTWQVDPSGAMKATGLAAFWQAMASFCRVAEGSPMCGANPPAELFAALPR